MDYFIDVLDHKGKAIVSNALFSSNGSIDSLIKEVKNHYIHEHPALQEPNMIQLNLAGKDQKVTCSLTDLQRMSSSVDFSTKYSVDPDTGSFTVSVKQPYPKPATATSLDTPVAERRKGGKSPATTGSEKSSSAGWTPGVSLVTQVKNALRSADFKIVFDAALSLWVREKMGGEAAFQNREVYLLMTMQDACDKHPMLVRCIVEAGTIAARTHFGQLGKPTLAQVLSEKEFKSVLGK